MTSAARRPYRGAAFRSGTASRVSDRVAGSVTASSDGEDSVPEGRLAPDAETGGGALRPARSGLWLILRFSRGTRAPSHSDLARRPASTLLRRWRLALPSRLRVLQRSRTPEGRERRCVPRPIDEPALSG